MNLQSRIKKLEITYHADPANCKHPEAGERWFILPEETVLNCTVCGYYGPCPDDRTPPPNNWGRTITFAIGRDLIPQGV